MKLYVARHGRTNYNDLNLCNSDPSVDVHLTELGIQQATEMGKKLKDVSFDQVYVSELKRTQQTAELINLSHAPVVIDVRLNDNISGYEGRHHNEYYAAFLEAEDKWNARFNGGESLEDVNKRVKSFVTELRTAPHTTVLIVTSEVIVKAINGILNDLSNEETYALQVEQGGYLVLNLS